jgi:hypothetical protein
MVKRLTAVFFVVIDLPESIDRMPLPAVHGGEWRAYGGKKTSSNRSVCVSPPVGGSASGFARSFAALIPTPHSGTFERHETLRVSL